MKYIINESRLNNAIEKFLKKNYDFIVSVSFRSQGIRLSREERDIERTVIVVVVDPYKILEGNLNGQFSGYDKDIRRDIWNRLNTFFSLGFDKYASEWDIEVYGVKLVAI